MTKIMVSVTEVDETPHKALRLIIKVSETGVESMARGGEPFHHRFILYVIPGKILTTREASQYNLNFFFIVNEVRLYDKAQV